jgi:choline kinase
MKAIILSAGQGRRLLPLTEGVPKCALPIHGRSLLEWQLAALVECGVDEVKVVVGFAADHVERLLAAATAPPRLNTIYNPFHAVADNLASCWVARHEMTEDFILLNGDTLFEAAVGRRLVTAPAKPVRLAIDKKAGYDADDMKVSLDGERLVRVSKQLPPEASHAESIGMMIFRGEGPRLFREALERTIRRPDALRLWYLSVIDELARSGIVWTASIEGLGWAEIDFPDDLETAAKLVADWADA